MNSDQDSPRSKPGGLPGERTRVDVSETVRSDGGGTTTYTYSFDVDPSMGSDLVLQSIMLLDLPVKVRPWELTVYPRSHIRR